MNEKLDLSDKSLMTGNTLHIAVEAVAAHDGRGNLSFLSVHDQEHWNRYLGEFDRVYVVARVREVPDELPTQMHLDDTRVHIIALPPYRGLGGTMMAVPKLTSILWRESKLADHILLRLPGAISLLFGIILVLRRRGFAVEMVGDIEQALRGLGRGLWILPFAKVMRWITRFITAHAYACTYVTRATLQGRYPPASGARSFAYSDVNISVHSLATEPARSGAGEPLTLCFCGSLANSYKGLDVLILAVGLLAKRGYNVRVRVMGDGTERPRLERQTRNVGVADKFEFLGTVTSSQVMENFRRSDLFVMPSLTEGLPRAMVEAMSQGLAAVGSNVGGIPELLDKDALVTVGDAEALARRISVFLDDDQLRFAQARRNIEAARAYDREVLAKEHLAFLQHVRANRRTIVRQNRGS